MMCISHQGSFRLCFELFVWLFNQSFTFIHSLDVSLETMYISNVCVACHHVLCERSLFQEVLSSSLPALYSRGNASRWLEEGKSTSHLPLLSQTWHLFWLHESTISVCHTFFLYAVSSPLSEGNKVWRETSVHFPFFSTPSPSQVRPCLKLVMCREDKPSLGNSY